MVKLEIEVTSLMAEIGKSSFGQNLQNLK